MTQANAILYQLSTNTEIPTYENRLPIHRKVYDKANMEMYELYLEVKVLSPDCGLAGIKTDCLVFNNITHDPPTSNRWGDIQKNVMYHYIKNALLIKRRRLGLMCMNQLTSIGILSHGHQKTVTKTTKA